MSNFFQGQGDQTLQIDAQIGRNGRFRMESI